MSFTHILSVFLIVLSMGTTAQTESSEDLIQGSKTYKQRCMLCHGSKGMGEGILPLSIEDYPNTNIQVQKHSDNLASIINTVRHGESTGSTTKYSPPWIGEISDDDISKVSNFILLLREDPAQADKILRENPGLPLPFRNGKAIYHSRCAICHGANGDGNGKLAKILQSPPPANLIASRTRLEDVKNIIIQGGEAIQRSPNMPPWGTELVPEQIDVVVRYIMSIRNPPADTLND